MTRKEAEDFFYESYLKAEKEWDYEMPDSQKRHPEFSAPVIQKLSQEHRIPTIHVTGSKGKGSVASMIAAVLSQYGKAGLMTSPHILSFNERFQINGRNISDDEFCRHTEKIKNLFEATMKSLTPGECVSPIGLQCALALHFFSEHQTDFNILEGGKGVRYDDVNNAIHDYAVINTIFLEHTRELGETLEEIATDKACIITGEQKCAYTAEQTDAVMKILQKKAAETNTCLKQYGKDFYAENIRYSKNGMQFDVHIRNSEIMNEDENINMMQATGSIDAVDGMKAAGSIDAVDGMKAAGSIDAVDGMKAAESIDAIDGSKAAGSTDAVDGMKATGSIDAIGRMQATGCIDVIDGMQATGCIDAVDGAKAAGSIDAIGRMQATGCIDAINGSKSTKDIGVIYEIENVTEVREEVVRNVVLPLLGIHQVKNCALAIAVCRDILKDKFSGDVVKKAIRNLRWPGRMEILDINPLTILDATINTESARLVMDILKKMQVLEVTALIGIPDDKDYAGVVETIAPIASTIILTKSSNPHYKFSDIQMKTIKRRLAETLPLCFYELPQAIKEAKKREQPILILGTTSLVADVERLYTSKIQ